MSPTLKWRFSYGKDVKDWTINIKNPAIKRQGQNYVIDFFYLGEAGAVLFAGGVVCPGAGAD